MKFSEWIEVREADEQFSGAQRTASFQLPGESKVRGGNAGAPWVQQPGQNPGQPVDNATRIMNFQNMVQQLGIQHPTIKVFYQKYMHDQEMLKNMQAIVAKAKQASLQTGTGNTVHGQ